MEREQELGGLREDWTLVERMLPEGWEAKARELGAIQRARGIADARTLLRVLLIHLSEGCSLRETAVRAAQGGLAEVSDVALLKRLRGCGAWFQWLGVELMRRWVVLQPQQVFGGRRVRVVDGSTVSEPGATGSSWRIHYAVGLPGLECDEVHVTEPSVGESLRRYRVRSAELLIADRGFAHAAGVAYVKQHGGDVIVRCNLTNLPLLGPRGAPFDLLGRLRTLGAAQLADWPVHLLHKQQRIPGRVCALRKSEEAAERARMKAARESTRKGHQIQPQTLEAAGYTFVFTTLGAEVEAACILEMYRGRWQIEIAFKRLKSLMQLGHLKKTDPAGAQAWLQGKLLVSLLVEALVAAAERFSPWGYPLRERDAQPTVPMAGDRIHA
jgi:hypothetical protein